MLRYDLVLLKQQSEDFIERLRELGLVDITTTGWEPQEKDRLLLVEIDQYQKALDQLEAFAQSEDCVKDGVKPYESAEQAMEAYQKLSQHKASLVAEVARLEKLSEEVAPWGEFDAQMYSKLQSRGVQLRYFVTQTSIYDSSVAEWSQKNPVVEISRTTSSVYFVIVTVDQSALELDAQEIKAPAFDAKGAKVEAQKCEAELKSLSAEFSRVAASMDLLQAKLCTLKSLLQSAKIEGASEQAADGALVVMEAWAEKERAAEVEAMLDDYADVVYLKREPVEEDDTPVKLQNNRFARLFELIGGMYALPKYGTLDLTPFFAPFYMLFFAICLNDAGYGAMILLAGLALYLKGGESMRQASMLTMFCGGATVLFGGYTGSLFGMSIPDMLGYENIADSPFLDFQGQFFTWSLALGVFQILLGMLLNICFKSKYFGITSVFGQLGWFIILLAACLAGGLPMLNEAWVIPFFTTSSPAFYAALGVGAVFMLLLNDIHRNPVVNFFSGLWDAYNNITGLLSDVLSYIRLFAIGLSGGVLAVVFNSLALGLTGLSEGIGEFGVGTIFQILGATAILLVGHGINLFMSAISSFVHPMRLTFVEFYKNAGFEIGNRSFEPVKKIEK
ncbi:MAG: V-type ATP synthase subunit I [Alistipes sp.]|nr:V-type ATP synthase subunit I [Alistipes sp.]